MVGTIEELMAKEALQTIEASGCSDMQLESRDMTINIALK